VLVLALVHFPLFLGRIVFARDAALWIFPVRQFVAEAFRHGQSAAWNPHVGLGISTLSNPLYAPLYPPHWLLLLAPETRLAQALSWFGFAHVVWGALGIFLLMRRLGGSPRAGLVAGLAWALSGNTASAWITGALLTAGAWLPWCGLGFVALVRSASGERWASYLRGVTKAALPVAMAFSVGEVFFALMGVGVGLVLALADARAALVDGHAVAPGQRLRLCVALVLAMGLGVAAGGGAVILPARAAALATERAKPLPRLVAEAWSLHPLRLLELVAPEALGDPDAHYPGAPFVGDSNTPWPLIPSVYLGASAMVLVLAAFRRRHRASVAIGILGLVALTIALGRFFVAHRLLRWLVPPLAYMRSPEKYFVIVVLAVALLAGLGADRVWDNGFRLYKRSLIFVGTIVGVALTAGLWLSPDLAQVMAAAAWRGAAAAGLMMVVVALGQRRPSWARAMMVTVMAVDLALAAWPRLPFGPASLAQAPPVVAAIRKDAGKHADGLLAPPRVFRVESVEHSVTRFVPAGTVPEGQRRGGLTLVPNLAAAFGLASVPGYDAATPTSLTEVWQSEPDVINLMRLLAVDYVIGPVDDPQAPVSAPAGLVPIMDPAPGARLFRTMAPLPRVFLAGHAEILLETAARSRLAEPAVLAGHTVLLAPSATATELTGPVRSPGSCRLSLYTNTQIEARCEADAASVAVFVEQYDPAWHAEVDGRPAQLERANLVGRAVRLSPGSHRVVLTFTPPRQTSGFALSGLGVLGLCLCWLYSRRRDNSKRTVPAEQS